jgi:hypothetical protein
VNGTVGNVNAVTSQAAIDLKVHMIIFIHQPQQIQHMLPFFGGESRLVLGVYSIDAAASVVGISLNGQGESNSIFFLK